MSILIDGYNLLHASGILGRGRGPGFLERSRQALLNFLAESLDEKESSRCTVVFDASDSAPKGLPRTLTHRGITVKFASGMPSADELIEQLIQADNAPRKLTVVSSDHRLHRAAKRRKATPIDSDQWFHGVVRRRIESRQLTEHPNVKPPAPSTESEINFWLRQFGVTSETDQLKAEKANEERHPDNPFPPGYGDDVLDEE